MRLLELKVHTALNPGKLRNRRSRDKSWSDRLRIKTPRLIHSRTLLPARKDFIRESSNREVTDKPESPGHFRQQ